MRYNIDLLRVGNCRHRKGKDNIYSSNGELYMHQYTGPLTMQVWSPQADDAPDMPGWAYFHLKTVEEDEQTILNYIEEVKSRII
ncbi:hypothetical protein [Flavobacterium sp.]|uniref:hypothetical protein n=1 Tax=Flavobacterium sp. TaxID=239 RepID=UPI0040342802